MKTMLVPVDFTPTSDNALRYAVEWAKEYGYERMILLKTLYDSLFDTVVTSADYMNVNADYRQRDRDEAWEKLNQLCNHYIQPLAPGIRVQLAISNDPLLRSILEVIETENAELVVLGSDNYNYSSDSFIGGNVIAIARTSPARVLIVPATYSYRPVRQALVPCNFNTITSLGKIDSYQSRSPKWKYKKLLVLNVDPKERYLNPDDKFHAAENALHRYLENFPHEVFYSNKKNIIDGIIEFSQSHDIQMIIALPGKRSFLYALTHSSISEAIYRNAKEPVLILK